jgi:hypothetical protein
VLAPSTALLGRPRPSWRTHLTREFAGHGPNIADPIYSGARLVNCSARLTAPTVTHSLYWGSPAADPTLRTRYIRMLTRRGLATSTASCSSATSAKAPHGLFWMAQLLQRRPPHRLSWMANYFSCARRIDYYSHRERRFAGRWSARIHAGIQEDMITTPEAQHLLRQDLLRR